MAEPIHRAKLALPGIDFPIVEALVPLPPTLALILGAERAPRSTVEALIEQAIAELDCLDGDADLEEDDPAGQSDEDGVNTGHGVFVLHGAADYGPGCPISDPGEPEDGI